MEAADRPASGTWEDFSACRAPDVDPAWFFPERDAAHGAGSYVDAKRVCAGCPVKVECLAQALRDEDGHGQSSRHGMFGGLSPRERARYARTLWRVSA